MREKIVVSGNCVTGGMAASLRALLPNSRIVPIPLPKPNDIAKDEALLLELETAEAWVTIGKFDLSKNTNLKVIKFPAIFFSAFHPDICYARKQSTNELTNPHYNSQIGLWAYQQGISPADAVRLFNYEVYKKVGYLDCWQSSVFHLKKIFQACDLSENDFLEFFNNMRRRGVFMHSINHPKSEVISHLMKLVISRSTIPVSDSMLNREIAIYDGLMEVIWPLYPEIGSELAIKGNYVWRMKGVEIDGIESFLNYSYEQYQKQGISPQDLVPIKSNPNLDLEAVLLNSLKKK